MASIITRSGRLYVNFNYMGNRYREITMYDDTPANRIKVNSVIKKLDAELLLGTFDYAAYFPKSKNLKEVMAIESRKETLFNTNVMFEDFANNWYLEKVIEWRKSQQFKIRDILDRYLIPTFGSQQLEQVKKTDLLEFRASLAKVKRRNDTTGLSPARINQIMTPLQMIINEAADRYEFVSPYRNIKALKIPKKVVNPLSLDEVKSFIETVRPDYRWYYTVRFFTGLRTSEIHGLPWKNVDFKRGEILIDRALVMGEITETKTDGSTRYIQLNSIAINAFKEQFKLTGKHEYVFTTTHGTLLDYNNVNKRVWFPTLKRMQLDRRRPYETRHTAATLWLASGESPEWIAKQMGHSTTKMLFDVYSRYVPNLARQDGSRMERLLQAEFGQPTSETTDQQEGNNYDNI